MLLIRCRNRLKKATPPSEATMATEPAVAVQFETRHAPGESDRCRLSAVQRRWRERRHRQHHDRRRLFTVVVTSNHRLVAGDLVIFVDRERALQDNRMKFGEP